MLAFLYLFFFKCCIAAIWYIERNMISQCVYVHTRDSLNCLIFTNSRAIECAKNTKIFISCVYLYPSFSVYYVYLFRFWCSFRAYQHFLHTFSHRVDGSKSHSGILTWNIENLFMGKFKISDWALYSVIQHKHTYTQYYADWYLRATYFKCCILLNWALNCANMYGIRDMCLFCRMHFFIDMWKKKKKCHHERN